jgi:putative ABC transport system permease protein
MLQDIKLATKLLWKDRGFATTAILTLAICIGANTAIFTIVNAVLLRPLPVPNSNDIVVLSNRYPNAGAGDSTNSGVPDYYDRMKAVTALQDQALYNSQGGGTIDINGTPQRVSGLAVTPSLFKLLQVQPYIGRTFLDEEGEPGNELKVVLSYGLWQQLYAGDRNVNGREVRITGRPYSVVGVMPKGFLFADSEIQLWTPLAFTPEQKSDDARHSNGWINVGRLKPGATLDQVQAQVNALNAANYERFPKWKQLLINAGFHTKVERLQDVLVRRVKGSFYLLWGGAAFVLLIGCVNIGNLVLARSTLRRKELTTRLALGATRARVTRYLIVESMILALAAGVAGVSIGAVLMQAIAYMGLDHIPRAAEIHMDWVVFAFAFGVAAFVGALIGLVPALDLFKVNLAGVLQEEGRTGTAGRKRRAIRQAMVIGQVAFAFVLLVGSALLLVSFRHLLNVDPGFKSDGVVTASVIMPKSKYAGDPELRTFLRRSVESIRTMPGVSSAGATTIIPFGGNHNDSVILAEGYVMKPGESLISPMQVIITPGYFEAIGATLKRGRSFTESDNEKGRAVIVDETLARKFWPNSDPIGRRMYRPESPDELLKVNEHTKWLTVVGVVGDIHMDDVVGNNSIGAYYFPYAQATERFATFAIKSPLDREPLIKNLRAEIAKIDPEMALFDIRSMAERTESSLMSRRTAVILAAAFGGIALFLSAVGIYGVLAFVVTQRTREFGIRIALGSSPTRIFRLVLREGLILVLIGLLLGLSGATALRSVIETQVYGVRPLDPFVIGLVLIGLAAVALSACALPALRATHTDPVRILNS